MIKSPLLCIIVMLLAVVMPVAAVAQTSAGISPFTDVPTDHWAYKAMTTLQNAGIIVGTPDARFGGQQALTRYEFAVAIARLVPLTNCNCAPETDRAGQSDRDALRSDLVQKLASNADAIDALRKLVGEFAPELTRLGRDVGAIDHRLDALEASVAAIEDEQRRIKFNGALNVIARGDSSPSPLFFEDANGRYVGADKRTLKYDFVDSDLLLGITGRVGADATANVKIDFGNYLASDLNTAGFVIPDLRAGALRDRQNSVWEADVDQRLKFGRSTAEVVAGRFGNQWTPYTLKQINVDAYTSLPQIDSGNIMTDGARVDLTAGPAAIDAWAGKFDQNLLSQPAAGPPDAIFSQQLPSLLTRPFPASIEQGAGLRVADDGVGGGTLGASFEQFGIGRTFDANADREYGVVNVYGIDFAGPLPFVGARNRLTLDANLTDSPTSTDTSRINDVGNGWRYSETDDEAGGTLGSLSLKGGYRYIGPEFGAPGSWDKIGAWLNPTNIEGAVGSARIAVNRKLSISVGGQADSAAYPIDRPFMGSPLQAGDKVDDSRLGATYRLNPASNLDLQYERVYWILKNRNMTLPGRSPGDYRPNESFLTFGIDHRLNPNESVRLVDQIIVYADDRSNFQANPIPPGIFRTTQVGDFSGNVIETQFTATF